MSDQAAEGNAKGKRKYKLGKKLSSLSERLRTSSLGKSTLSSASSFKTHSENVSAGQTNLSTVNTGPSVLQPANSMGETAGFQPGKVSIPDNTTQAPKLHADKEPNIPALKDITEIWNEA